MIINKIKVSHWLNEAGQDNECNILIYNKFVFRVLQKHKRKIKLINQRT